MMDPRGRSPGRYPRLPEAEVQPAIVDVTGGGGSEGASNDDIVLNAGKHK